MDGRMDSWEEIIAKADESDRVNQQNAKPVIKVTPQEQFRLNMEAAGFSLAIAGDDAARLLDAYVKSRETKRGMFICGSFGCGKSHAAMAMFPDAYRVSCSEESCIERLSTSHNIDEHSVLRGDVILDDVGSEYLKNEYGVMKSPIADFIAWRYGVIENNILRRVRNMPPRTVHRLIITTNLNPQQIGERYGGRILSRIVELCIHVPLTGADKRRKENHVQ